MTVQRFVTIAALLIASATGLLIGSAVGGVAAEGLVRRAKLESVASLLASNVAQAAISQDSQSARQMLASAASLREIAAAAVYLPDGRLFSSYLRSPSSVVPRRFGDRHRENIDLEVVQLIMSGNRVVGILYVAGDRSVLRENMLRPTLLIGSAALLSLLIATGVASRLQRRILLPIRSMSAVAFSVASGQDYTMRARGGSLAEIRELSEGFNAMISDFNARDAELRHSTWKLEEEVLRRTAELTGTNTLLSAAKKTAEEAARMNAELRSRIESILQSAAEGIFGLDANGVVVFINRAGADMLGWDPQQLVGKASHPLIHAKGEEATPSGCRVCAVSTSPHSEVTRFRTRSGTILPVEYASRAMAWEGGSAQGVVVTFRDITERLAIEKMKDEFVSTVSHELRTPLTSIRGALGNLNSGLIGDFHEKGKRMLQIAVTNADRLIRLVNDILDVERAASGRIELAKTAIVADDLMKNAIDVMQAMADHARVRLEMVPSVETIEADPDRMMQTITNLISNAIKFSPAGKRIAVSAVRDGDSVVFAVADEGRGIPPDKLGLVFERFKQVDASDSRDKGGSGLGLAIVRGIVEAHGGHVWVESTVGVGSTFFVAIPAES